MKILYFIAIISLIACNYSNSPSTEQSSSSTDSSSSIGSSSSELSPTDIELNLLSEFDISTQEAYKQTSDELKCEYALSELYNPLIIDYRVEEELGDSLVNEMRLSVVSFYENTNMDPTPDSFMFSHQQESSSNYQYSIIELEENKFIFASSGINSSPEIDAGIWLGTHPEYEYLYLNNKLSEIEYSVYKTKHFTKIFYDENLIDSIDVDKSSSNEGEYSFKTLKFSSNCNFVGTGTLSNHISKPQSQAIFNLVFTSDSVSLVGIHPPNEQTILETFYTPSNVTQEMLDSLNELKNKQLDFLITTE